MLYTYETYPSGSGYGYRILADGISVITQPFAPAINSRVALTERQAQRLGQLVVDKLTASPNSLPCLGREEVISILNGG